MNTIKLTPEETSTIERLYFLIDKLKSEGLSEVEYEELEVKIEELNDLSNGCLELKF